jgi:uncharacterized membrane protein
MIALLEKPPVAPDPSSTGLDPKVAGLLCYLAGPISGIIFLILEKQSRYVRIHALQSIIVFVSLSVINLVIGIVPLIGWLISSLLSIATFVLWIALMVLALQGRIYKLPVVGDFAEQQANRF